MKNFWEKLNKKKKPILALAPMAGVTDSAFRQMCKYYGADVVYTEMVSADGLYYDSKKTLELLSFEKNEKPVVVQLFGKNPNVFAKAAKVCEEAGFDGIDINFGCPAKKVVAHGGGVTLMRNLDNCRAIIEAVMSGTNLPISVKTRTSIKKESSKKSSPYQGGRLRRAEMSQALGRRRDVDGCDEQEHSALPRTIGGVAEEDLPDERVTVLDFIEKMKDLPISAIMVHGRPHENPFTADIDYETLKKVKEKFNGVVLGNGGINTPEDAGVMIEKSGVDGVGLARGLYGKPWLFKQVKDYLKKGKYKEFKKADINKAILRHGKIALKAKGEHGLIEMRKHLLWYVAGWPGAKKMRADLVRVENIKDIKKAIK